MKNTKDMDLARSIDPDAWRKIHKDDEEWCQKFADLVRADEREACAKLFESNDGWLPVETVAAAIRARVNP